jgi:hypothetical protein
LIFGELSICLLFRCIRLDGPAARCSGRPKLPRQFVPVRHFEPRLFVPMPGNMGRSAFTFINLYIFCNLQRIINKNIHLGYASIYFLFRNSFAKIENVGQRVDKIAVSVPCVILGNFGRPEHLAAGPSSLIHRFCR